MTRDVLYRYHHYTIQIVVAVYGAAMGGRRLAALFGSDDNVVARALRKPAAELDVFDACAVACLHANEHGPWRAAEMHRWPPQASPEPSSC